LDEAATSQRLAVRDAVRAPAVGATLLSITRYIEETSLIHAVATESKALRLGPWTEHRLRKIKRKLDMSTKAASDKKGQHRARILAKRLRYGLESMQSVLPHSLTKRWLKDAAAVQGSIGVSRDFQRLQQLAVDYGAVPGLVEFLRGYVSGINVSSVHLTKGRARRPR
jgi:CHAD domain-containing protein